MIVLVGYYDTAVLVSGDGDLAYAVNAVSYQGVRVEVVSLRSMTSDSLFNVADRYMDLDLIKEDIQKYPRLVDASVTTGIGLENTVISVSFCFF